MQGHRAFGPRPAALHLTRMVRNKTSRRDRRIAVAAAFTPGYARRQVGAWFRNAVPGAPGGQGIPAAAESQSQAARRWALNQTVKNLIQKLGEAIHESVSESEHIAGVVKNIRDQGFDVMLMLEATIGLNQVEAESGEPLESSRHDQPGEFTTTTSASSSPCASASPMPRLLLHQNPKPAPIPKIPKARSTASASILRRQPPCWRVALASLPSIAPPSPGRALPPPGRLPVTSAHLLAQSAMRAW